MVSCTNLEASNTDVDPDPQEVTKVETNKSIKKKLSPLYKPVVEEKAPSQPIMNCSQDTNLLKLMGVNCLKFKNLTLSMNGYFDR